MVTTLAIEINISNVNIFILAQLTIMFYYHNGISIDTVTSHNDLGILFDDKLRFHDQTTEVTDKANQVLGMIKKSFEYLDSDMLSKLFTTLVRPILEHSNAIWGSLFILDQRKAEGVT